MCYINIGDSMEVKYCTKFKDRLLGLMFKNDITPMCFPKCHGIHTFFMKKPIDVIMADKNKKVIKIYKNIGKNKILYNKNAYYIYELPVNFKKINLGDII